MANRGIEYLLSDTKRSLDVIGALGAATLALPTGACIGLLSTIDSRSNPFFVQQRAGGRGDERFNAYKFRTLKTNENVLSNFKSFGTFDPRASWLGSLIRRSGLDELPQLVNVLKGEMSLVGPRPLAEPDIERYESAAPRLFDEWMTGFSTVKPGLIGKSQLHRHHYQNGSGELLRKSMELDLRYFDTANLIGDIKMVMSAPAKMIATNIGVIKNSSELSEKAQIQSSNL